MIETKTVYFFCTFLFIRIVPLTKKLINFVLLMILHNHSNSQQTQLSLVVRLIYKLNRTYFYSIYKFSFCAITCVLTILSVSIHANTNLQFKATRIHTNAKSLCYNCLSVKMRKCGVKESLFINWSENLIKSI